MKSSGEWRPVIGYEGLYEVSRFGRVRALFPWRELKSGRIVPGTTTPKGYAVVSLSRGGIPREMRVHRLVLEAFVGPAPRGHETGHRNGVPNDNRLENLRWITSKENTADTKRLGRWKDPRRVRSCGEDNPNAKLSWTTVQEIRKRSHAGTSRVQIARDMNLSPAAVSKIALCRAWLVPRGRFEIGGRDE